MTFNIRGFPRRTDGLNTWPNRAPLSAVVIRRHAPEVVGLQEARARSLDTFARELPEYAHVLGPVTDGGTADEANAILFDPVRLELLDSGGFWLRPTSKRKPSALGFGNARSATWARFRHVDAGLTFLHLNTHLDHLSAAARSEGSRLILDRLRGLQGRSAVVVTGDFNCRPGSVPYRAFLEDGFEDAFVADNGNEHAGTFHGFHRLPYSLLRCSDKLTRRREPLRMDWILFKGGAQRPSVEAHSILRDHAEDSGVFPSDHYPVLATLSLSG